MLKQVTLSFHGLSSPSLNAPWESRQRESRAPRCPCTAWWSQSGHCPLSPETGFSNAWEGKELVKYEQDIKRGKKFGPKNKEREESGDPRTKKRYYLSPFLPHGEKVFALLFPHPVYMPHPISKWPARPLSHSLYPGYKSGLRTLFKISSPLSYPAVLTASPILINLIFLSLCLMSGNSFPPVPRPQQLLLPLQLHQDLKIGSESDRTKTNCVILTIAILIIILICNGKEPEKSL